MGKFDKLDLLKEQLDKIRPLPAAVLQNLQENFLLQCTYNSNAIEGNTLTLKETKMAIYLLFIQHIIYSLSETGKAAVVVPTDFITAQAGIERKIREKIVDNGWLKGVVSMPSNIFATTGTNVSIIFIDKTNKDGKVVLVDASKLGEKRNDDGNQKTYLSSDDEQQIIDAFSLPSLRGSEVDEAIQKLEDLAVVLDYKQIKAKNYSLAAGQYFEIKIAYSQMSEAEFKAKIKTSKKTLTDYFGQSKSLETEILKSLDNLHFNGEK